jgi:hypothetical protein
VEHGRRAPEGFEASTPNVARMYDYYLGGKDNFPADRQAAERVLAIVPEVRAAVRANRAFVGRAVRFLAAAGVRQFLDVGSGLPTRRNVHEVAHELAPDARVVYVDDDPVVVVHGRALLACTDTVAVVQGDLRRPEEVLGHPEVRALIDLDEPVAVLLTLVLHFVTDAEDPVGIVRRLRDAMAPGSYLVVSHGTGDPRPGTAPRVAAVYQQASAPIVFAFPRRGPALLRRVRLGGWSWLRDGVAPGPVRDGLRRGTVPHPRGRGPQARPVRSGARTDVPGCERPLGVRT